MCAETRYCSPAASRGETRGSVRQASPAANSTARPHPAWSVRPLRRRRRKPCAKSRAAAAAAARTAGAGSHAAASPDIGLRRGEAEVRDDDLSWGDTWTSRSGVGFQLACQHKLECRDTARVERGAGLAPEQIHRGLVRPWGAVDARRYQRVVDVAHGEDACVEVEVGV